MKKFMFVGSLVAISALFADSIPVETLQETPILAANTTSKEEKKEAPLPANLPAEEGKKEAAALAVSAPALESKKEAEDEPTLDVAKISEAFGHMIAKNISQVGAMLDIARVIKGLQDSAEGKTSPMTEAECAEAISAVQERIFHKQCKQNLEAADRFLKEKGLQQNVVSLEAGKVQYTIEKEGTGSIIETHFSPLIRYKGKYLDGTVFGVSSEGEKICLDEIIPGLKSGLVGMKEGERRTIYIHPDLAYGTNGYLPPNSLLTFEIELIQANAPDAHETDLVVPHPTREAPGELAGSEEHVR